MALFLLSTHVSSYDFSFTKIIITHCAYNTNIYFICCCGKQKFNYIAWVIKRKKVKIPLHLCKIKEHFSINFSRNFKHLFNKSMFSLCLCLLQTCFSTVYIYGYKNCQKWYYYKKRFQSQKQSLMIAHCNYLDY